MINFILGAVLGFFVANYGVMGVAHSVENGINTVKNVKITSEK
jgi:hypothetical protein